MYRAESRIRLREWRWEHGCQNGWKGEHQPCVNARLVGYETCGVDCDQRVVGELQGVRRSHAERSLIADREPQVETPRIHPAHVRQELGLDSAVTLNQCAQPMKQLVGEADQRVRDRAAFQLIHRQPRGPDLIRTPNQLDALFRPKGGAPRVGEMTRIVQLAFARRG